MGLGTFCHPLARFVRINQFRGKAGADRYGFTVPLLAVVPVDVHIVSRGHYSVEPPCRGPDTGLNAAPRHYRCTLVKVTLEDFLPADNPAALLCEEFLDAVGDIALEILFGCVAVKVRKPQLFDPGLTKGTVFPSYLWTLVSSYVDVFRREKVQNFREHIFQKLEGVLFAGTKHVRLYAPGASHLIGASGAAKFRVRGKGGHHMTGQVDLRNYSDSKSGGI